MPSSWGGLSDARILLATQMTMWRCNLRKWVSRSQATKYPAPQERYSGTVLNGDDGVQWPQKRSPAQPSAMSTMLWRILERRFLLANPKYSTAVLWTTRTTIGVSTYYFLNLTFEELSIAPSQKAKTTNLGLSQVFFELYCKTKAGSTILGSSSVP